MAAGGSENSRSDDALQTSGFDPFETSFAGGESGLSSYQDQTGLATLARTINLSWRTPVLAKAVCRKHSPFVYHVVR